MPSPKRWQACHEPSLRRTSIMNISRSPSDPGSINSPWRASCLTASSRKKSASKGSDGSHVYNNLSDSRSAFVGLPVSCCIDHIRVPP